MLRNVEGKRRRWQQRMRWLDSITNSMDMSVRIKRRNTNKILKAVISVHLRNEKGAAHFSF